MGGANSSEVTGSPDIEVDTLSLYKQIMEMLKPGETLTKVGTVRVCETVLMIRSQICPDNLSDYLYT